MGGFKYVDLDKEIVRVEDMPIPQIFSEKGEPYFREVEAKLIKSFPDNTVVATGGGAMQRDATAEFAKERGVVFFLNADFMTCYERIKDDPDRPLAINSSIEDLYDLYRKRFPVYRRNCTYEINADQTDKAIVEEILSFVAFLQKGKL